MKKMINNTEVNLRGKIRNLVISTAFGLLSILIFSTNVSAQNSRPTPTPERDIPAVISRDSDSVRSKTDDDVNEVSDSDSTETSIELPRKNSSTTTKKESDTETKQKKMLLYLDLLTRTEQREAYLQKQLFDMLEKQNSLNSKLKQLEYQMRPEVIRTVTSLTGSMRPEDLRDQRKKSLELEKASVETLVQRVDARIRTLETNVRKAEALVEKIRLRFDKIIDDALNEEDKII